MAVVCRAVAGLRSSPSNHSDLLTQEIFGRSLQVESVSDDWAQCTLADGYRGWLPLKSISADRPCVPTHIAVKRFTRISSSGHTDFLVPMGSLVRAVQRSGSDYLLDLPDGKRGRVSRDDVSGITTLPWSAGRFRSLIREVTGTPYLWGGKSTFGFDCSGLVQFAFGFFGIDLPRDSGDQAKAGTAIKDLDGLGKYDLVFFGDKGRIDHVAVHLGRLKILHASGCVRAESLKRGSRLFRSDLLATLRCMRRVWHV
ncbi:MAG: C40 family peptidase [Candidatus Eisenbacteria bacterium]